MILTFKAFQKINLCITVIFFFKKSFLYFMPFSACVWDPIMLPVFLYNSVFSLSLLLPLCPFALRTSFEGPSTPSPVAKTEKRKTTTKTQPRGCTMSCYTCKIVLITHYSLQITRASMTLDNPFPINSRQNVAYIQFIETHFFR